MIAPAQYASTGEIMIDRNHPDDALAGLAAHEFLHALEATHPEVYKSVQDHLADIAPALYDQVGQDYEKAWQKAGNGPMNPADVDKERASAIFEDVLRKDPSQAAELWKKMAGLDAEQPGTFQKIADTAKYILQRMAFRNPRQEQINQNIFKAISTGLAEVPKHEAAALERNKTDAASRDAAAKAVDLNQPVAEPATTGAPDGTTDDTVPTGVEIPEADLGAVGSAPESGPESVSEGAHDTGAPVPPSGEVPVVKESDLGIPQQPEVKRTPSGGVDASAFAVDRGDREVDAPIGNVWAYGGHINPVNPKTLEWLRKNPDSPYAKERPKASVMDDAENSPSYRRLVDHTVDDGDDGWKQEENKVVPHDPSHPRYMITNGTHRVTLAMERGDKTIPISVSKDKFSVDRSKTQTPEFKKWFDGSKVVDEDGEPKVVYHGSDADFNTFDRAKTSGQMGFHLGSEDQAKAFSDNPKAYHVSIKNPLRLPDLGGWQGQHAADAVGEALGKKVHTTSDRGLRALIEQAGYDGVVYENRHEESGDNPPQDSYIAFHPSQIKSVDNAGTFDSKNPDTRFAVDRGTLGDTQQGERDDRRDEKSTGEQQADSEAGRGQGGVRGTSRGLAEPSGANPGADRQQQGEAADDLAKPLVGLPGKVKVDGREVEFGPFVPARKAAADYAASAGIDHQPPKTYVKVDPARAKRIADAFDEMTHAPESPEVKAAYDAMIAETLNQWKAIKKTGLKVEFNDGKDPYGNPRNAILDVVNNNHLWVFPTDDGFGGSESAGVDISGNPLLQVVPGEQISGKQVRANDIFRIVHDYFGHIAEGTGFRADGEENAWRLHSAMYSDLARKAMTTETRGQNSWVNFGPFAEHNRTTSGADTQYAPQKIGLLPDWAVNEGARDQMAIDRSRFDDRKVRQPDVVKLMSGEEKPPELKPSEDSNYGKQRFDNLLQIAGHIAKIAAEHPVVTPDMDLKTTTGKEEAVDAIYHQTMAELDAWGKTKKDDYTSFYRDDITERTNPELQKWAMGRYRRELKPEEVQLLHLLSAYGSGQTTPTGDTVNGMKVFDEYMRTGKATGYSDKPKPIYRAPARGESPQQVFVDSKTGEDTFVSAGNEPKFDPVKKAQVSKTYNTSGVERLNVIMDHFGGDLKKTMEWVGSEHPWSEIESVIGAEDAKKLQAHEYLNREGETFGAFALGNNPKLGSYILNRWQQLGTITKDMWVARTMSRYFNEPNTGEPWDLTKKNLAKRELLDEAWGRVASDRGLEPADVQEQMWDAEKNLYNIMGHNEPAAYTSMGVPRGKEFVEASRIPT